MYTYQMFGIASENNKTYESKYGTYNSEKGFDFNDYSYSLSRADLVQKLLNEDCWSLLVEKKKMSISEIEEALGYPIELVSNKDEIKCKNVWDYLFS